MNKNKLISFQSKFPNTLNEYELIELVKQKDEYQISTYNTS